MQQTKKCPYCGEEILAVARKCKHCGEWLDGSSEGVNLASGTTPSPSSPSTPTAEPTRSPFSVVNGSPVTSSSASSSSSRDNASSTSPHLGEDNRGGFHANPRSELGRNIVCGIVVVVTLVGAAFLVRHLLQRNEVKETTETKVDPVINFADSEEDYTIKAPTLSINEGVEQDYIDTLADSAVVEPSPVPVSSTSEMSYEEMLGLGECYEKGVGVEQDYEQAFQYYYEAAQQGGAEALNKLGNMYAQGRGCVKDMRLAAHYYLMAAQKGNPYAQHNVAFCYWDGVGIEQNRETAIMWMRRSADQGYAKARKALRMMGAE